MSLNKEQLEKLADLFIDLAKGLFLAALAIPSIYSQVTFLAAPKGVITGFLFVYLSLKTINLKEEK